MAEQLNDGTLATVDSRETSRMVCPMCYWVAIKGSGLYCTRFPPTPIVVLQENQNAGGGSILDVNRPQMPKMVQAVISVFPGVDETMSCGEFSFNDEQFPQG